MVKDVQGEARVSARQLGSRLDLRVLALLRKHPRYRPDFSIYWMAGLVDLLDRLKRDT
jgi:hypothetical protein